MSQTIQQLRAKYALEKVIKLESSLNSAQKTNFVSYTAGIPAMTHINGLGQAMAFCKSKGSSKGMAEDDDKKRSYNALYQIISEWLCQEGHIYGTYEDVLQGITQQSMQDYQLAQTEMLLLMGWVKKLAKAYFPDEEDNK